MSDMDSEEIAAIADLVRRERKPEVVTVEHDGVRAPLLILPNADGEYAVVSVKDHIAGYRPTAKAPEVRAGTAKFKELDSFLAHVARFKDGDSAIWANPDRERPSLTSVLDYHRTGPEGAPRFGRHRGVYSFERSPEFVAWNGAWGGQTMSQADFARFVEQRIVDVADPIAPDGAAAKLSEAAGFKFASAAELVTLSRGLKVHVKSSAEESFDPTSGETSLVFTTQHATPQGEKFTAPRAFLIDIPVFRGGDRYLIVVWLRYRLASTKDEATKWWIEGYRILETFDHAFNAACTKASETSGLPLFVGDPES